MFYLDDLAAIFDKTLLINDALSSLDVSEFVNWWETVFKYWNFEE